jgi:hypothetical protein
VQDTRERFWSFNGSLTSSQPKRNHP